MTCLLFVLQACLSFTRATGEACRNMADTKTHEVLSTGGMSPLALYRLYSICMTYRVHHVGLS